MPVRTAALRHAEDLEGTKPVARAAYVYAPSMSRHVLRQGHPMRPVRLQLAYELLEQYGAFASQDSLLVTPRSAHCSEMLGFHTQDYVAAVQRLSAGGPRQGAERYGFSDWGDNPIYHGMYEAALLAAGASVQAAELVADELVRVAFSPAGGLHHAMASNASGFCIFNDPVVAINVLRRRGLRVAYVDIDAHHGDGVQAAFYADPDVLTVSVHEDGRYLFPGTGSVAEIGVGEGRGYSVNLPLFPYSGDDVFADAFEAAVLPLLHAFKPDVLATQLGIDTHFKDPLTHLALTSHGYVRVLEMLASEGYPWLAFGGGGYDLDAVARCWTLAYGVMLGRRWPDEIPPGAPEALTNARLHDVEGPQVDGSVRIQAQRFAEASVASIRSAVFPIHGL